jgi:hypothetical protein
MRWPRLIFTLVGLAFPTVAFAQSDESVERGLQVSIFAGCHDCHTQGYSESAGKIDPEKALIGSPIGFKGPWGTSYATNLRYRVEFTSERGFVVLLKNMTARPPMPWYNIRALDESDMIALYRYIKSLGPSRDYAVYALPPGEEPTTPYIQLSPLQMPKN